MTLASPLARLGLFGATSPGGPPERASLRASLSQGEHFPGPPGGLRGRENRHSKSFPVKPPRELFAATPKSFPVMLYDTSVYFFASSLEGKVDPS
jgi:hypothetical protein